MARKVDIQRLKKKSIGDISDIIQRVKHPPKGKDGADYLFVRWMCAMSVVELHSVWERFAEIRMVALLNHDASHFVAQQNIVGIKNISVGLAFYIVRGGNRYLDFRSMSDLIGKADRCTDKGTNPFRKITVNDRRYLDGLATIRNCVVHRSDAARAAYRRTLKVLYGISSAPDPDEFLAAKDNRGLSPKRYHSRLEGLATGFAACHFRRFVAPLGLHRSAA